MEANDKHAELKAMLHIVIEKLHFLGEKISSINNIQPLLFADLLRELRERMNREKNILISAFLNHTAIIFSWVIW